MALSTPYAGLLRRNRGGVPLGELAFRREGGACPCGRSDRVDCQRNGASGYIMHMRALSRPRAGAATLPACPVCHGSMRDARALPEAVRALPPGELRASLVAYYREEMYKTKGVPIECDVYCSRPLCRHAFKLQ
jgi:hypothetical protein